MPTPTLLPHVVSSLEDDKAEDIVVIDLQGRSSLADQIVIASGRSHRHVSAMAEHLQQRLKDAGAGRVAAEGLNQCDWVLIDGGDVIVHLFRPEVRAFYDIERIWTVEDAEARDPATNDGGPSADPVPDNHESGQVSG